LHLTYFKIWWRHWYPSIRWWHQDPSKCLFSLMCSPSSWATEDDPSTILPFYSFFVGTRNPSSNQILSPLNKFSPMLERGMSTSTLASHLHFPCFMFSIPKKSRQGESLGSL
jgi:hypothetical protein